MTHGGAADLDLTVIISVEKGDARLHSCLDALSRQTLPLNNFEVILVPLHHSEAGMQRVLAYSGISHALSISQLDVTMDRGLNAALGVATGQYCLFLDEGVVLKQGALAEHLKAQRQRQGIVALGCIRYIAATSADRFVHYRVRVWNERTRHITDDLHQAPYMDACSANFSVSRQALLAVGGFATDLPGCQNIELFYRLHRHKLSFVSVPGAAGCLDYNRSAREIIWDVESTGAADVELYSRHPGMLPHLRLGQFSDTSLRLLLLRRCLLIVGARARLLLLASSLIRKQAWAHDWYRLLEGYCYWRGVRRAVANESVWGALLRAPVILMYHAVDEGGEPPSRYVIPGKRFYQQMEWLKRRRYHVIGLEDFIAHRLRYGLAPARSVIITFDDGYTDNRTVALPILREHAFPATIFLVSGTVGGTNLWDRRGELAGRALLSWQDIREMLPLGIQIGAHTRHHHPLTSIGGAELINETQGARLDLERGLGVPINTFAYPHGQFDEVSLAAIEQAGFQAACCSRAGVNEPSVSQYALRRIEIPGTMALISFALAVWTGSRGTIRRLLQGR